MPKKKVKKQPKYNYKKYLRALLKLCLDKVPVDPYRVSWAIAEKDDERERSQRDGKTLANILVSVTYLEATITFFPFLETFFHKGNYTVILETVVHELSHILTDPLYDFAVNSVTSHSSEQLEKVREQQTELISRAILKNLQVDPHPKHILYGKK